MSRYFLTALVLALLVTATACEKNTYPAGPSGTVANRNSAYFKSGGWHFWLTVNGSKFRVTRSDYKSCFHGSRYPACTNR